MENPPNEPSWRRHHPYYCQYTIPNIDGIEEILSKCEVVKIYQGRIQDPHPQRRGTNPPGERQDTILPMIIQRTACQVEKL